MLSSVLIVTAGMIASASGMTTAALISPFVTPTADKTILETSFKPDSTSWALVTPGPNADLQKRDCSIQVIYIDGQDPITSVICASTPVCSVCVGCNAPVTICS